MLPLAFFTIAGGILLLVAGVTGSSLASVVAGHPDGANAKTPSGKNAGGSSGGEGPAAGVTGGTSAPGSGHLGALAGPGLTYAGPDQGIDFTGAGTVRAPARIRITRAQNTGSGWDGEGGLIVGQLLSGPSKGRYVYFAEDLKAAAGVTVGAVIEAGDAIAHATGSGRAPGIEVGFAQGPTGQAYGNVHMGKPGGERPIYGEQFRSFIESLKT